MFVVDDGLDALLLGCFWFGLLFTAVTLLTGATRLQFRHGRMRLHLPHRFHVRGHPRADTPTTTSGNGIAPLNDSSLLAFVAWFGGVGYLARHGLGWPWPISLALGAVGGLAAAAVVVWVLMKLAAEGRRELNPADFVLPGIIARVTSSIRAGGVGEIVYELGGTRHVSAARAKDARAIGRGTEVVIVAAAHGTAVVEPWAAFLGERHADLDSSLNPGPVADNPERPKTGDLPPPAAGVAAD